MFRLSLSSIVSFVSLFALLPSAVQAQEAKKQATVAGQGITILQRMPSSMRMTVQLSEKSKTLKGALAKLKDRRAAAVLMLKKLKANEASIVLSDPSISADESQQQRHMRQLLAQQQKRSGKKVKLPTSITVVCAVTADWPIEADSAEQLLLATKTIQDQVIAADLAGANEPKKLTPEEEELAEEAAEQMNQFGGYNEDEAKPGTPRFIYVARITEQQRKEALSAAFVKSKKMASDLADAASTKLGSLVEISSVVANENRDQNYGRRYGGYGGYSSMQQMMMQAMTEEDGEPNQNVSFSTTLGKIYFRFLVRAKFNLQ